MDERTPHQETTECHDAKPSFACPRDQLVTLFDGRLRQDARFRSSGQSGRRNDMLPALGSQKTHFAEFPIGAPDYAIAHAQLPGERANGRKHISRPELLVGASELDLVLKLPVRGGLAEGINEEAGRR